MFFFWLVIDMYIDRTQQIIYWHKPLSYIYSKPKSNFTLLIYIYIYTFSGYWCVVHCISNIFIHIYVRSIIHMTVAFHDFCCHKCNQKANLKEARGQDKLFKNASLLMCYCSFEIGQYSTLKNQSERQA